MPPDQDSNSPEYQRLLSIVARLRAEDGCPWDREQSEVSMAPHLLEEAYEAVEAIQSGDAMHSCEELGDVLMNVLMVAQIASEAERFNAEDVARGIADKLVRRHPHVFGDVQAEDSAQVLRNWETIKQGEKAEQGSAASALDGVPLALPALLRAFRMGEKAARIGFDWPDQQGPRAKLAEELAELDQAIAAGDAQAIQHELGDLLFSVTNLARHLGQNPEMALAAACQRFGQRFALVEQSLGSGLQDASLEEMEEHWQRAKARLEKKS